jgi:hypothetical protein
LRIHGAVDQQDPGDHDYRSERSDDQGSLPTPQEGDGVKRDDHHSARRPSGVEHGVADDPADPTPRSAASGARVAQASGAEAAIARM